MAVSTFSIYHFKQDSIYHYKGSNDITPMHYNNAFYGKNLQESFCLVTQQKINLFWNNCCIPLTRWAWHHHSHTHTLPSLVGDPSGPLHQPIPYTTLTHHDKAMRITERIWPPGNSHHEYNYYTDQGGRVHTKASLSLSPSLPHSLFHTHTLHSHTHKVQLYNYFVDW